MACSKVLQGAKKASLTIEHWEEILYDSACDIKKEGNSGCFKASLILLFYVYQYIFAKFSSLFYPLQNLV